MKEFVSKEILELHQWGSEATKKIWSYEIVACKNSRFSSPHAAGDVSRVLQRRWARRNVCRSQADEIGRRSFKDSEADLFLCFW